MPEAPTAKPPVVPEGAGLKSGPQSDGQRRSADDLIDAAAAGHTLEPAESDDLVAYYLSNGELPGDSKAKPLSVKLGEGSDARKFRCSVRSIEWSEWQDARERATNEKTGRFDAYVSSSWVVARALVTPKLGPTVLRQQKEAADSDDGKIAGPGGKRIEPPGDAAHLLRRMFVKQSGALLELSASVLERSKLQNDSNAVEEVEAAKN